MSLFFFYHILVVNIDAIITDIGYNNMISEVWLLIILQGNNLSKSYGVENIFNNLSLIIRQGEKIGLVGPNGVGKSTLLKCLIGEETIDSGSITIGKNIRIGYLPQTITILDRNKPLIDFVLEEYEDLLKLRQEIIKLQEKMALPEIYNDTKKLEKIMEKYSKAVDHYEREGGYSFESKIKGILIGLGFSEEDFIRNLNTFSGGQKTRIALAKILLRNPELLILDEPTNYLDLKAVEWLENYLQNYTGSILVVSHDRYFLDQVTKRTLELKKYGMESYPGNYSRYLILKEQREEAYRREYEKQQEYIQKQEEFIRKYKSGIKAKQARGRQSILNRLERIEKLQNLRKKAAIEFKVVSGTGEKVLEIHNLKMEYPGNILFQNLSFDITKGEKIALIGDNGTGKTTLLKIIAGKIKNYSGKILLGSRVKIAYFTQEHEDLNMDNTVLEELWINPRMTENEVRSVLGRFLFSGETVEKKVGSLSGGERGRLKLAKLFVQNANLLILDEPTNHIDVETKEVLEDALIEYPGNLLFVSHDRYFINKLATKILELENGKLMQYLGNFDYYKWKKKEFQLDQEARAEALKEKEKRKQKEKQKQVAQQENSQSQLMINKNIKEIEKQIEHYEDILADLSEKLADSETYNNPQDIIQYTQTYKETENILQELYSKWEDLME